VAPPKPAPVAATASNGVNVEVYQGDKPKQEVKFPEENSETK
jgi:hypothetical protein